MKRPLQILLCFVPSFAVGWLVMSSTSTKLIVPEKTPLPPEPDPIDEKMAPLRAAKDRWTAIHAAIQLARDIPPRERQAWLDGARFRHSDPLVVRMFTLELEEILFQEDPYGCLAAELTADKRFSAYDHLIRLAKLDPAKLIAFGQGLSDAAQGRHIMLAGMKVLVESDPAAVLKLALDFPPPADGREPPLDMVKLLAKASVGDVNKLLDLADQRGDRWRSLLRAAAARALVTKDFATGLKWLAAEPDAAMLYTTVFSINGVAIEETRANARMIAEHLDQLPAGFGKLVQAASRGGQWPETYDMDGAEELWLTADLGRLGLSPKDRSRVRAAAVSAILYRDAAAAAKYLSDPTTITPKQRQELLSSFWDYRLRSGGTMPPEIQAILSESELKMVQAMEAKFQANQAKPRGPLSIPEQFAAAMNDPGSDALMMRSENWTPEQVEEALAFVRNAKPEVLADMVKRLQHTGSPLQPLAAEAYRLALVSNTASKEVRNELIETAIHWADNEPAKAAAWVETLPAGPERLCSIQNVAAQWGAYDPSGAEKWIAALKDKSEADAAREAIKIFNEKTKQVRKPVE